MLDFTLFSRKSLRTFQEPKPGKGERSHSDAENADTYPVLKAQNSSYSVSKKEIRNDETNIAGVAGVRWRGEDTKSVG